MSFAQRCLRHHRQPWFRIHCRSFSAIKHNVDDCGIPLRPTWSVNTLLSSYPTPTLSSTTLTRLHGLSALIPPAEGTLEHTRLKKEVEDLIKLVEAVKMVNTNDVHLADQQPIGYHHDQASPDRVEAASGQALLKHATRTSDAFYVVDSNRKR